ncbi:hypothetical protein [Sphingomonas sp.]|uniref:hypothetical protein n=1 Tax=Sphingomonas sp. TaxID=28214 RepID=UPI002DD690DC|nr:hypothetical protein [Sphingomonas sp.]
MNLGFGQILTVLAGLHPDAKANVLEARLKYFQRIPFPATVEKVGSGGRAEFGVADFLKLVLTFELLAAGIAPRQAAALVDASWAESGPFLARAWISRSTPLDDFILVHPAGLSAKKNDAGSVEMGDAKDFAAVMRRSGQEGRRVVTVNAGSLATALDASLAKLAKTPRDETERVRAALNEWADVAGRQVFIKVKRRTGT